ncbi:MAG: aldo/keto reductase [Phycisphaeraceae bacterium]|nr:aldo/keto reductase [Phycisphaeraceae bacterium]
MMSRTLGRSGMEVSALGLGCWAIGGAYTSKGVHCGWGDVDDAESIRAVRRGVELGVTFFDTAECYGAGHSEEVLGRALRGMREDVVIATKFGHVFKEGSKDIDGDDPSVRHLEESCEASLRRLGTDYIDVMQFHMGGCDPEVAAPLVDKLEDLVRAGKVLCYGWSTDDPHRARLFARGEHCSVVQHHFNLLEASEPMLELLDEQRLAGINRGPLAKGILTGKFRHDSTIPANDVRHRWNPAEGDIAEAIDAVEAIRPIMEEDGRTLAQAALGWIWARHPRLVPICGFKTVKQVEDNIKALEHGPLTEDQMRRIEAKLKEIGWKRRRFA